jgi:hypothetical protein
MEATLMLENCVQDFDAPKQTNISKETRVNYNVKFTLNKERI